jgi:hypothetical protein
VPELRYFERKTTRIDQGEVTRGASATLTLAGTVQLADDDYDRLSKYRYLIDDKGAIFRRDNQRRVLLDEDLGKVKPKQFKEPPPRPPKGSLIPEYRVKKDPRELRGPRPPHTPKPHTHKRPDHPDKQPVKSAPLFRIVSLPESPTKRARAQRKKRPGAVSKYSGVFASRCRFYVAGWFDGKQVRLGTYELELDAAAAYNWGLKESGCDLPYNLGADGQPLWEMTVPRYKPGQDVRKRTKSASSRFIGVSRQKRGRWRARVQDGPVIVYSGRFDTELEAAHAFNEAIKTTSRIAKVFNRNEHGNII